MKQTYVEGTVPQQTYLGGRHCNNKSVCTNITKWKQFNKQTTTDTKTKHSTLNLTQLLNNKPARTVTRDDKKHRPRDSRRPDTKHSALNKLTVVLKLRFAENTRCHINTTNLTSIRDILRRPQKYIQPQWIIYHICNISHIITDF